MKRLKIAPTTLSDVQIAAIGPATAEEIKRLGLKVAVVPDRYVAESVVEGLRGKVRGKRVLLARAKVARDVIPRELRKMGAKVDLVEAYNTITPASSRKQLQSVMRDPKHRPHIVCFTSSSSVRNFVALLNPDQRNPPAHRKRRSDAPIPQFLAGMRFASIGPITSATLRELGFPVNIEATEYTIPGLIQAISAGTIK
jgi:uroporphyrinogen-III synthase